MYLISIHPYWLVAMGFGVGFFAGTTSGLLFAIYKGDFLGRKLGEKNKRSRKK